MYQKANMNKITAKKKSQIYNQINSKIKYITY